MIYKARYNLKTNLLFLWQPQLFFAVLALLSQFLCMNFPTPPSYPFLFKYTLLFLLIGNTIMR
jgi:hypothetical protein